MNKYFVFLDLETSGLDPNSDQILEIAVKVVDENLLPIPSEHSFGSGTNFFVGIEKTPPMNHWCYTTHSSTALIENCFQSNLTLNDIEQRLVSYLKYIKATDLPMCGNSVHFDRAFLKVHMPELEAIFSHRNIDISSFMEALKTVNPNKLPPKEIVRHTAMEDVEMSIKYFRHYLNVMGNR